MSQEVLTGETEQPSVSSFYYSIGDFNILLESGIKTEIIEKRDIFPIPHSPTWCQGMISLRGKLIPVANLHQLFDGSDITKSHWLLVMEITPYPPIAILIDQLPMQQILNKEPVESTDNSKLPRWFESSMSINDKKLYRADHSKLLEQLIQENEISRLDLQEQQSTSNQDSSGHNA